MKKLNILAFGILGMFATSCSDFLDTNSPSVVDADFVFSNESRTRAALDGAYETWRDAAQNSVFGDGLFYAADVAGSDIERHPEGFTNQPARHYPECFYQNGTYTSEYTTNSYTKDDDSNPYNRLFKVIGQANAIITAIEGASNFQDIMKEQSPLGQMYGEAIALRAVSYRELIKNYGDVPYAGANGKLSAGLQSRDSIYDVCIADLEKVVDLMYPIGSMPGVAADDKHYFSKTFVQGLIGRMCLDAAGYQTRRGDIKPVNAKGEALTFETKGTENQGATYGRRSDWKEIYAIAKTHLGNLIKDHGSAKFYTSDPRKNEGGRTFDCPYQYFFEQMMMADAQYADESIYEYAMQQGNGNDGRPYSFGRPSSGGSKNAYPCKSYGQGRINPAYYYGNFDPKDMRRDVSVCVTGSDGKGAEKLIPFKPGSKADAGGLTLNKWDENRQVSPWTAAQRTSGINGPYMRMAEMYLSYAEVCAALNDNDPEALNNLKLVRERSFRPGEANTEAFVKKCGSVWRAIIEDRGFEFAGEGDRRWTLIRTGLVGENIMAIKNLTTQMMDDLNSPKGFFRFENGNEISLYVWTKMVDAKTQYGHRLTANGIGNEENPVLYPGWRGQNDSWEVFGATAVKDGKTNIAIKGLFKHIAPDSEEAKALEADGYTRQDWGKGLLDNRDEYEKYLFLDYDGQKAPIYLWPFTHNIQVTGGFTNGYGFNNK